VFASDIVTLITFGGMAAETVYLLIAIGSINSRLRDKESTRPFKMPLFPIPSIIVILFLVVLNLGIGFITPPYGSTLFVASAISKIPVDRMFKTAFVFTGV
ncbi:TRAP transporter large permease subunit, partial [Eubacteriales bacterium DFI.9.88]|nr:TRAP transporter large permease subunit [Eubacteriales bacterium DFI.9.88]